MSRCGTLLAMLVPAAFLGLFFLYPLGSIMWRGLTAEDGLGLPLDVLGDGRTLRGRVSPQRPRRGLHDPANTGASCGSMRPVRPLRTRRDPVLNRYVDLATKTRRIQSDTRRCRGRVCR